MSQPSPTSIVTYVLGAWDLAIGGDLLLQGVLFAQTAHYFALYHSDLLALRMFVLGLLFFTTLKSMQMIAILWTQNVTHFTDIRAAGMMFTANWLEEVNIGFGAFIAFYIQTFMCQRLWALCKNPYIVLALMATFTFAVIAALIAVGFTFNDRLMARSAWITVHFGVVVGGDILLCSAMVFFLLKHSKQVLPQTAGILNAILKLTIQSAMPGAICAMLTLVTSQVGEKANPAKPSTMISIITSNLLPKFYALSAMCTLNSRRTILLSRLSDQNTSSNEGQSGGRRTGGARAVELGDFGKVNHIQVRTQVQTTHHIDNEARVFTHSHDLKGQGMEEEGTESGSTKNSLP